MRRGRASQNSRRPREPGRMLVRSDADEVGPRARNALQVDDVSLYVR
jgi:hypothetical protein